VTDQTAGHDDAREDLPPSANYVYDVLDREGPLTVAQLIDRTNLPEPTVRFALDRLGGQCNLSKTRDSGDARKVLYNIYAGQQS
jgi:DNA-binding MarR family transcriptional regulator